MNKPAFDNLLRVLYASRAAGAPYNQGAWSTCAIGHCKRDSWFQENYPRLCQLDEEDLHLSVIAEVFVIGENEFHGGWPALLWLFGSLHENKSIEMAIQRFEEWLHANGYYDGAQEPAVERTEADLVLVS